jgi:hypothetical protein
MSSSSRLSLVQRCQLQCTRHSLRVLHAMRINANNKWHYCSTLNGNNQFPIVSGSNCNSQRDFPVTITTRRFSTSTTSSSTSDSKQANKSPVRIDADYMILGGGPVGASTAWQLAEKLMEVDHAEGKEPKVVMGEMKK